MRGDRRSGTAGDVTNADGRHHDVQQARRLHRHQELRPPRATTPTPRTHIYNINIPGCDEPGRVFVGQRKESFAVNLGTIFDLVNAPAAVVVGGTTATGRAWCPAPSPTRTSPPWRSSCPSRASRAATERRHRRLDHGERAPGARAQPVRPPSSCRRSRAAPGPRSRACASPLVNEVVIGLPDKDRFNASEPKDDGQFAAYVTNPTLPALLEMLFGAAGVTAPNHFPRADLVAAFLTGVTGVNANGSTAEMLRLNTALRRHAEGHAEQPRAPRLLRQRRARRRRNPGCDPAGFPNGRRPGDDVVDIALRVAMGYLLPPAVAPSGQLGVHRRHHPGGRAVRAAFPYLRLPSPAPGRDRRREESTMKTLRYLILAAALAAAACGDDDDKKPADGAAATTDSGAMTDGGASTTDGGATADAGGDGAPAVTLVAWVSDLVERYTTATADPDTVTDKNVADTDNPAAFNPLLTK